MIFALFLAFIANLILRLNEFVPGFRGFPLAEVMIPIIFAGWILFEKKDFSLATDVLLPLFFIFVIVGYMLVWPSATPAMAKSFLPWLLLYFLAANLVHTQKRMDWTFAVLLLTSLALVAHSVQQSMNFDGLVDATGVGWSGETMIQGRVKYIGVMSDPNDLALFFVMMIPLALQLCSKGMPLTHRIAGYALCAPLLYGVFLTNSRGGMLACGAVAASYAWRRWGMIRAGMLVVILAMVVLAAGPSRLREKTESDDESSQGRIEAWYEGFQMFRSKPLLGVGKDEFETHHFRTAHNSMVLCFAETGFLGYMTWLGSLFLVMYGLYHVLQRTRPGTKSYRQTVALFDSLAGFFAAGFFLSRTYFIVLPVFLGLAVARYKATRNDIDTLEEETAWNNSGAEGSAQPLEEEGAEQTYGDLVHQPEPLPDISWKALPTWMPRLACLSFISIVGIYVLVRIKL